MSLVYFLLWVIFAGKFTYEIVIAGIVIAVLLDLAVKRFLHAGFSILHVVKIIPDVMFYLAVLLIEMLKSSAAMIRLVLSPELDVEPCIVKFRTGLKTSAGREALAEAITLASGGVSVSAEGETLSVHTLNHEDIRELEGNVFGKILSRMERISDA